MQLVKFRPSVAASTETGLVESRVTSLRVPAIGFCPRRKVPAGKNKKGESENQRLLSLQPADLRSELALQHLPQSHSSGHVAFLGWLSFIRTER